MPSYRCPVSSPCANMHAKNTMGTPTEEYYVFKMANRLQWILNGMASYDKMEYSVLKMAKPIEMDSKWNG